MLARLSQAALLSLALGGAAFAQTPPPASATGAVPGALKQFPLSKQWTAVSLNGKGFPGQRPTFQVDDQLRARGFAGCNTFSATSYPLPQQRFAVGPLAITRLGCETSVMTSERAFLVALRTAARWDLRDGFLVLEGPNGEIKFERGL